MAYTTAWTENEIAIAEAAYLEANGRGGLVKALLAERVDWQRSPAAVESWLDKRRRSERTDSQLEQAVRLAPVTYSERPERCQHCGSTFLATDPDLGWVCPLCGTVHYR